MVCFFNTFNKHIINIDLYILADLVFKDFVDESLVRSSYILKTKRHYFIIVHTLIDHEGHIFFILMGYFYLVVTLESVHKTEHSMV